MGTVHLVGSPKMCRGVKVDRLTSEDSGNFPSLISSSLCLSYFKKFYSSIYQQLLFCCVPSTMVGTETKKIKRQGLYSLRSLFTLDMQQIQNLWLL